MSKISDAAKAAAVMNFVSDSEDDGLTPERAVALFDELGSTFGPVDDVLEKYNCTRWGMYDDWPGEEYWECIEVLAVTIDAMIDHFEFRSKEQINESEP